VTNGLIDMTGVIIDVPNDSVSQVGLVFVLTGDLVGMLDGLPCAGCRKRQRPQSAVH